MSALSLPQSFPISLVQNSQADKNFGLSEAEYSRLAHSLGQGDHRLFERVFLSHYKECQHYLMAKDGVSYEEAYDLTMDTLLRFRDLIVAGKISYGNLRYLFTRMARQAYVRSRKKTDPLTCLTGACIKLSEEEPQLSREDYDLLSRSFNSLGKDCRTLLRAFYYLQRSLKEIATEEERSPAAVRKQKSRCVATLRRYFYQIS